MGIKLLKNVSYFTLLLVFVLHANHSYGQFFVQSTSPAQGATSVNTATTIEMTFNSAIDTSARFPFPEDFFINVFIFPDSLTGEPDSITVSPDLHTVYVHNLHLSLNTTYMFIIVNAVSLTGDSLETPYSILFSTGNSLPTNSVSGTINYPGNDPTGTMLILFDKIPFGEEDSYPLNGTVVPTSAGTYTVSFVETGTYWPVAAQNLIIDRYGEIDIQPGSSLGFYDINGDGAPDSVEVTSGASLSGIDMTLFDVYPQTARDPYPNIETLAQSWAVDAHLVQLAGDAVKPDGKVLSWQYAFYSPSIMEYKSWVTIVDLIISMGVDTSATDTLALPTGWVDSNIIMAEAEANGGSNFRQQYSDADVFALLGHYGYRSVRGNLPSGNVIPSQEGITLSKLGTNFIPVGKKQIISQSESSFPLTAVWVVDYYSDSANVSLVLLVDALTGNIVGIEKPDEHNLADRFILYQNYPNPFNPTTTIKFDLPKTSQVTLKVFNTLGEEVTILVSDRLSAGSYSYEWDASNLASGVYLCSLQTGSYITTRKMMLLK
jgi:hypothetical protein